MRKTNMLLAVATVCSALFTLPNTASAQGLGFLSFLWDEGAAREVVPFHPRHAPGQIIVSFGDRKSVV